MSFLTTLLPPGTERRRLARLLAAAGTPPKYAWRSRDSFASPFFIVGSGRCGTTLLRRLLQDSPEIHIPPENWAMNSWLQLFNDFRTTLQWEQMAGLLFGSLLRRNQGWFEETPLSLLDELCALPKEHRTLADFIDTVYRFHGNLVGSRAALWADKTPLNVNYMPQILHIFPGARFVFMLRDPADVVYSWSRVETYLGKTKAPATRWKSAYANYMKMRRRYPERIFPIRYEDLVTRPARELQKIAGFLNMRYQEDWIAQESDSQALRDIIKIDHLKSALSPISQDSIGKGRRSLAPEQRAVLQRYLSRDAVRAGYKDFSNV